MKKFKALIESASKSAETMKGLVAILDDHFEDLEEENKEMYWEVMYEIYELINGAHFDEETAKYAVSCMQNEDGTEGEHWSLDETTSVAKEEGLSGNMYDWYYVLNMIYSDYFNVIGDDTSMYVAFAKAWILDKDAPDGKPYLYWKMTKG